jgi:septal ring factor EnvC (AmiA/AmiB activator)
MKKYLGFLGQLFRRRDDQRGLMEKLRDQYRLVIMNEETFEEVSSLKLSPLSVYVFTSSVLVATAILVTMLIVYTPLKRYIPGYGDFSREREVAELTGKVRQMEKEMEAHRRYNDNLRRILLGDVASLSEESSETGPEADTALYAAPDEEVSVTPEEEMLRSAVEQGTFTTPAVSPAPSTGPSNIPLEQIVFMPPLKGEVTANFDVQRDHFGIDIAAPRNTPVKATADGVVVLSGYTVETGYSIAIQHPNNTLSFYKHNSALLKKEGSAVRAGEAIAIIGNTGERTSGPHLHFELWYRGRPVDPGEYMVFN